MGAAQGLLVLLGALAVWAVARAFARSGRLTPVTSWLASLTCLLHAALVVRVAWEGRWPLPVAVWLGALTGSPLLLGGVALYAAAAAQLGPSERAPGLRCGTRNSSPPASTGSAATPRPSAGCCSLPA